MMTAKPVPFAPKKILCPLDLSAASLTVLNWAGMFAEIYHAKLELLHAEWSEYPPYFLPSQEAELEARVEQHRAALREHLAKLAREALGPNLSPEIAVLEGHPVEVILARVASTKPDLIVMGSHGRSGISRLRLGSVAENVVRTSLMPTLVAKARTDVQPAKISRVLCPVNFTEGAIQGLKVSADVARAFRAQLVVLHAVEEGAIDLIVKRQELCQWVPAELRNDCDLVEVIRHGNTAEQILLTARDHAVDLIILEAGHRPFLDFTILGTTAERVIRHADSAVLVLP
jgi:nucleotide-binding universal stress UspA family protein